jgi:hypothetical protein
MAHSDSESIYRNLFPNSAYGISDQQIIQCINEAKENADVELSIMDAIRLLEQRVDSEWEAENMPSDREMHHAGCF